MVGGKYGLSPIEKSIIGRSVINIYEPYLQRLKKKGLTQDYEHAPTLIEFYNDLCNQPRSSKHRTLHFHWKDTLRAPWMSSPTVPT